MTSGLVNASFSLPEWQAVKMIFFAPWVVIKSRDQGFRPATMSAAPGYFYWKIDEK